jgi:hypothetical protein
MQLVRITKPGRLQMGDRRLHALGHHKLDIMDFDIRFSGIATDIKQIQLGHRASLSAQGRFLIQDFLSRPGFVI